MTAVTMPRYRIVVPFFNEVASIQPLLAPAVRVLRSLPGGFEALLVDDGSTDGTARELDAVAADEPRRRVIRLDRNGGPAADCRAASPNAAESNSRAVRRPRPAI